MTRPPVFLGICEGYYDPSVAVVSEGEVLAYSEEERHLRYKHAAGIYPQRALDFCLRAAGVRLEDVASVAIGWDLAAYTDGTLKRFFRTIRQDWAVDSATISWQESGLRNYNIDNLRLRHERHWRQQYGDIAFPRIDFVAHHRTHAFHATMQSKFDRAICLTIDGSGDQHTAVLWRKDGTTLEPLREIYIPHSLGWVYAAFTEYLGFTAYDGEYKVMGLAAYGRPNEKLREKLDRLAFVSPDGVEFRIDPSYVHYGSHSYSGRYTDTLVELLGRKPRLPDEEITPWHEDLAFAVQDNLERHVERLVLWAIRETGIHEVCIGGGVGLNVKMNSRLLMHPEVHDVFAQPLCHDAGAAIGAALAVCFERTGATPGPLQSLDLGPSESAGSVEEALVLANLSYERPPDICEAVAKELACGRIVGWFQGRMEAGPRALGQRSILADPRRIDSRDKVNAIVKFREYWRPFCPSMTAEAAPRYFDRYTEAPFMILAFAANERLRREAPAIVHVDGTSRVQFVDAEVLPRYHRLLTAFERETGVPVLLNTSFNVRGEPIVCTIQDALRTFWATGLDVLAAEDFLVRKPTLAGSRP